MKQRLTELTIARLKPPKSGRLERWDTHLAGFGIRISPSGSRAFVVVLRRPGALHPARYALEASTLKTARKEAGEALADPAAFFAKRERSKAEQADTFGRLAEQFLEHGRTKRGRVLRPATLREYTRSLLIHAQGLHHRPVRDVRRGDVAILIRKVAAEHGATSAMRTRAALSRFFSWLVASDLADANVVTGTEGYAAVKGSRVLSDAELRALWAATAEPFDLNLIIRLCLWTGCRRSEAGGLRRAELEGGTWTVPASRTKNHRQLVLPLARQMREALAAWPQRVGRDCLFGFGQNGFQGWSYAKRRLDAQLNFAQSWDLHDIRRTVETRMAGLGIAKDHVNKLLNHADGPVTAAYDHHSYLPEKAHALQRWADALDRITGPEHANVVPLKNLLDKPARAHT